MAERVPEQWSGSGSFLLVALGATIGLGNIWKLPQTAAENGGGLFWLLYLLLLLIVAVPIMVTELALGRLHCASPMHALRRLTRTFTCSPLWEGVAWGGALTGVVIFSFFSVIGGWVIAFGIRALGDVFAYQSADQVGEIFTSLVNDPEKQLAWHTLFVALIGAIIGQSVRQGIERFNRIAVPLLLLILLILLGYVLQNPALSSTIDYLFAFRPEQVGKETVMLALGHAFFSLTLGLGAMMAYGAYLGREVPLVRLSLLTALLDMAVAIVAGLALIPILIIYGQPVVAGPQLLFHALPAAFGAMPLGELWGGLFYLMLLLIATSSVVCLTEPAISWLMDRGLSRHNGAWIVTMIGWVLGVLTIFSFHPELNHWVSWQEETFFEWVSRLSSNFMLPSGR